MQKLVMIAAAFCGTLMLIPSTATAADPGLDAIPKTASVVIRLKNPEATVGKIADFARAANPNAGQMAMQLGGMLGVPIQNPVLQGVDRKRDWLVAVFPQREGEPAVVFGIPSTDNEAMKMAVGGRFTFVEADTRLFYSESADAAKLIQDRIDGNGESIQAAVDESSQAVLDGGDLSVFLNVPRIREIYTAELEAAETEIESMLDEISNLTPQVEGMNMEPIFELYGQALHGLLRAVADTEGCSIALAIKPEGLTFEDYVRLTADSATDKLLQAHKPSPISNLMKLPHDQLVYSGFNADMASITEAAVVLSKAMVQTDEETSKQMDELLREMKDLQAQNKLQFGSYSMAMNFGKLDGGALRMIYAAEAEPMEQVREFTRKMTRLMSELNVDSIKQEVKLETDAEMIGQHSADIMTLKQEINPEADPFQIQQKLSQYLYGPDGMTTRIVYLPKMVVQTVGGGKAAMETALEGLTAGGDTPAARTQLETARAQLLKEANILVLMDLPQLAANVLRLVIESGEFPLPLEPEALDQLDLKRSYLGFSLATEPAGLRAKTSLPAGQVEGFVKLGMMMQRLRQQPQF